MEAGSKRTKFENHNTIIVASRKEINGGMSCEHPEAVIFALK